MKNNHIADVIHEAREILRNMEHAAIYDVEFPLEMDFTDAARVKSLIDSLPGLFLNSTREQSREVAHSANTMMGDVCPSSTVQPTESDRAASSETEADGQKLGAHWDADRQTVTRGRGCVAWQFLPIVLRLCDGRQRRN